MSDQDRVVWKIGDPLPQQLASNNDDDDDDDQNVFLSTFFPRCIAWCSVELQQDDGTETSMCALLDGLTAASYTPPSIICAASALPSEFISYIKQHKKCTLSTATVREPKSAYTKAGQKPLAFTFDELGLTEATEKRDDYPIAVKSSPIHMYCSLDRFVPLDDSEEMLILLVETFVICGSVLSPPTEEMKKRPNVTAKIDAQLIQPMVSLGRGRFEPLTTLKSMPRPYKNDNDVWESPPYLPADATLGPSSDFADKTAEWSYKQHGGTSPLGYNATTALVMPRPIGWISSFRKSEERELHLAPYSFFTVIGHGKHPMVAFSGFRRDGKVPKDAQKDAQETGCYCYNMVTQELIIQMNLSAAELGREESEFGLSMLESEKANFVDAPVVKASPIRYECEYVKTEDVGSFSIVIGRVVGVSIAANVLGSDGSIDKGKIHAMTRLGYMDEYGVI